jgi:hypothetical protein
MQTDAIGIPNHKLQKNLKLDGNWISNDGDDEGIRITDAGLVGIGVTDPDTPLEIFSTSSQLKLSYDATYYADISVANDGHLELATTGGSSSDITLDAAGNVNIEAGRYVHLRKTGDNTSKLSLDMNTNPILEITSDADAGDTFSLQVNAAGATTIATNDDDGEAGHLNIDPDGEINLTPVTEVKSDAPLKIKEAADAVADTDTYGQIWVKNEDPEELWFTTGGGDDVQITSGTSLASGGGSGDITGVTLAGDSGTAEDLTANVNLTIAGGNAVTTSATSTTVTINHDDTSTQASVDNSGTNFIQDITLDTYGHITAITSADAGSGGATALDGLSDVSYSSGDLTITSLDKIIAGALEIDSSGDITLDAAGDQVTMKFGSAAGQIDFTNANSGDGIIQQKVDAKDLVIQQFDGDEVVRFTDGGDVKVTNTVYFAAETANTIADGATEEIDWNVSQKQKVTITGTGITCNFANPAGPCNLLLKVIQGDGSDVIGTWDTDIKWAGGSAPTLSTGNGEIDIISFYWDGTNYFGAASLDFQ